jgi:hypothetical protein
VISLSKHPRLDEAMASGRVGPLVTRKQVAGAVNTAAAVVSSPDLLDVLEALGLVPAGVAARRVPDRDSQLHEFEFLAARREAGAK